MLKLSSSRKVSPLNPTSGSKGSKVKNAFSLPSVISCPGSTPSCREFCYAGRDERRFPNVKRLVDSNFEQLKACGRSVSKMAALLRPVIAEFKADFIKRGLPLAFRIHEDGDFYSAEYARAWARVIQENPDVQFWAYTRSWRGRVNVLPHLIGIENLSLYVSVDQDNAQYVSDEMREQWEIGGVRPAYATDMGQEMSVSISGRKSPNCPEITGRIPLVNDDGVGACIACGLCIKGIQPVNFNIHWQGIKKGDRVEAT